MFDLALKILGLVLVLKILISFFTSLRVIIRHLLPCQNLKSIYGSPRGDMKSWAVITGGTEGIGKAFCEVLAAKGFNICIISRNPTKIDNVIEQLKKINTNN